MTMKNKRKNKTPQNIVLIGKKKAEITKILGENYTIDLDGNMVYTIRRMVFFTQRICIGFNEAGISDSIHSVG
ncbi:hypothetical protein QE422_003101 [Chryseobacterium sp. SORGH_AS 447]|nr:hypothetical protein [Chryseobacterium sp. SORGH_AS_0447]